MELHTSIRIERSPDEVFAALSDLDSFEHWMANLVRVEKLTDAEFGVGTEFVEVRRMMGHEGKEHFRVTECVPGKKLTLFVDGTKGTTGKGEYHFDHFFEAVDGGTEIRIDGRIEMPGFFAGIMMKIMGGSFKKMLDKDLQSFKAWIEPKSPDA